MCTVLRFGALLGLMAYFWTATSPHPRATAQGVGQDPNAPRKEYEFRLARVGDTYQGIRFKPATGETWQLVLDKWERLPELAALPGGDYDVTLIPTENSFIAIRQDRKTGATWLFQARRWNPVKEAPAPKEKQGRQPAPATGGYEVRHVRVGKQLHLLRFHTRTGEAASVEVDTYQIFAETMPIPLGDYEVTMIATADRWMAIRADRGTGATWLLKDRQWHAVSEP